MSEAKPRNIAINESAPAGARGAPATPAGVRIVVPLLPGGSLRSPPAKFHPASAGIHHRIYEAVYQGRGFLRQHRLAYATIAAVYKHRRITVVIPCLNEEKGVVEVLARMPSFVDEIIVVDNDSTDRTAEFARELGARVIHEKIRGYGRAYKTGLFLAQGDVVVTLDGDHSYPVDAISYLLEVFLRSEERFLSASRFPLKNRRAMSAKHWIGNKLLSLAMSLLFFRWVRDSQSGMWVFERQSLAEMSLVSDGMAFSEEIKIEALRNPHIGFKEFYIDYSNRMGEMKLEPWKDGVRNLLFMIRKRFGTRSASFTAPAVRKPQHQG